MLSFLRSLVVRLFLFLRSSLPGLTLLFGVFPLQDGYLRLYDIGSGELLEEEHAHDGAIWSIALQPDEVPLLLLLLFVHACMHWLLLSIFSVVFGGFLAQHEAVTSCPLFLQQGFVTASADHTVKFWEYELQKTAQSGPG